jgi:hypothetical protein
MNVLRLDLLVAAVIVERLGREKLALRPLRLTGLG